MIFNTVSEARRYRASCPLCSGKLSINDHNLSQKCSNLDNQIFFAESMGEYDTLSINMDTNRIYLAKLKLRLNNKRSQDSTVTYVPSGTARLFHCLKIECKKCWKYSFSIKMEIDLNNLKMIEVSLSNEAISIEDNGQLYEIKNVYSMDKMEFYQTNSDDESRSFLPIIPINFNNPKETLNRIKNILIFS